MADKAIQHVSPFSFPWPLGSGFPSAFLSELKTSINHNNNGAVSSERQRIMAWNVDDVASHVRYLGCADQAKIFIDQVRISAVFLLYDIFLQSQISPKDSINSVGYPRTRQTGEDRSHRISSLLDGNSKVNNINQRNNTNKLSRQTERQENIHF